MRLPVAVRTPADDTLTVPPEVVAKNAPKRRPKEGFHDTDMGRGGCCCACVCNESNKATSPKTVNNIFLPDGYPELISLVVAYKYFFRLLSCF